MNINATTMRLLDASSQLDAPALARARELVATSSPSSADLRELGVLATQQAADGASLLVTRLEGSPGVVADALDLLPSADLERYRRVWTTQLAGGIEPAAADARVREMLDATTVPSTRDVHELDALVHGFGAKDRLGLPDGGRDVRSTVRALLGHDPITRNAVIDAWRHATRAPDDPRADLRSLIAAHRSETSSTTALLRMVIDSGHADRLGLPTRVAGREVADVLRSRSARDEALVHRTATAWSRRLESAPQDVDSSERAALSRVAGRVADAPTPAALDELRTLAVDLDGASRFGLHRDVTSSLGQLLTDAHDGSPASTGLVRELAGRWHTQLDTAPDVLRQVDEQALDRLDAVAAGTATASDVGLVRRQLLELGGAARAGLPTRLNGRPSAWDASFDSSDLARYATAWSIVRDIGTDRGAQSTYLRDRLLAPSVEPAEIRRMVTLAADLGHHWDLGLPMYLAGDDVAAVTRQGIDPADPRLRRILHAWQQAVDPSDAPRSALLQSTTDLMELEQLDATQQGWLLHLLLDRGMASEVGIHSDPADVVRRLVDRGRPADLLERLDPAEIQTNRFRATVLQSTTGGLSGAPLLRALADGIPTELGETRSWLVAVRDALADPSNADVPEHLRTTTDALIDRNLERLAGRTPTGAVVGYYTYPDYAELGRIAANARLTAGIADHARQEPPIAATTIATDGPSSAPGTLTW